MWFVVVAVVVGVLVVVVVVVVVVMAVVVEVVMEVVLEVVIGGLLFAFRQRKMSMRRIEGCDGKDRRMRIKKGFKGVHVNVHVNDSRLCV